MGCDYYQLNILTLSPIPPYFPHPPRAYPIPTLDRSPHQWLGDNSLCSAIWGATVDRFSPDFDPIDLQSDRGGICANGDDDRDREYFMDKARLIYLADCGIGLSDWIEHWLAI